MQPLGPALFATGPAEPSFGIYGHGAGHDHAVKLVGKVESGAAGQLLDGPAGIVEAMGGDDLRPHQAISDRAAPLPHVGQDEMLEQGGNLRRVEIGADRKSTRLNSSH